MTPEQQRIAIAEACGWQYDKTHPDPTKTHFWNPKIAEHEADVQFFEELPNYPNDLNAIHEAEKILTKDKHRLYVLTLGAVVKAVNAPFDSVDSYYFHATASQRAEAFLRTIGKWKE